MRVGNPLAIGRPSASCPIAVGCLGLLATVLSSTASAGVDAWTTTGPRSAWLAVITDTSATGAIRVFGGERTAVSGDRGSTWTVSPSGPLYPQPPYTPVIDDWRFLDITPITPWAHCQDPATPGRLFYGDENLSRSDDGGRTWQTLSKEAAKPFYLPRYMQMDCVGPVIFAIVESGLQRSMDAGVSFVPVPLPDLGPGYGSYRTIAFDGQTLVASVGGSDEQPALVPVSADQGATWKPNPYAFPVGKRPFSIVAAAGGRFVALVGESSGESLPETYPPQQLYSYRFWTSDDSGKTFVEHPQPAFVAAEGARLRVDVLRRSRVLAVGSNVLRVSGDAGSTWQLPAGLPAGQGIQDAGWAPPASANAGSIVVATADLGVLVSDDGGTTFLPRNNGLPGARMGQVDSATYQGERAEVSAGQRLLSDHDGEFARWWEAGVKRRGAESNRWTSGPIVGSIAVEPLETGTLLSVSGRRSANAGATWTDGPGGSITARFTTLPGVADSPAQWYIGTEFQRGRARLYDAGAALWRELPTTEPAGAGFQDVRSLAIAASSSNVVYVAKLNPPTTWGGPPWIGRSADRGATFESRVVPGPPSSTVSELWVDPDNANHLLAALEIGAVVHESYDGAATWVALPAVAGAVVVFTFAVDMAASPKRIYAGTDDGVFVRVGNAATWQQVGESLGMRVGKIRIDGPPERRTLTLATDRGVFELTQDSAAATLPVFRFYNTQTRTHFYTASQAERDHVIATWPQFIPEGIAFHAVKADRTSIGTPVWRFFNTQTGTHFYTASPAERAHVLATWPQFVEEGVVYRALAATEPGTVKLFRFFNTETGAHFTTTEDDERDYVNSRLPMFVDEGPTYSVYPAAPSQ